MDDKGSVELAPVEGTYPEDGIETDTAENEETGLTENTGAYTEVSDPVKKHIERVVNSPVEMLLLKLEQWLLQQPEWAVILASPRAVRRSAITLLSKRLLTIPQRYRGI